MSTVKNALLEAIRDVIRELADGEGWRTRQVALLVDERHPELKALFGDKIWIDHLARLVQTESKRWASVFESSRQLSLPGLETEVVQALPACISLKTDDGECVYRPLSKATVGEFRQATEERERQLQQDTRIHDAFVRTLAWAQHRGLSDDDLLVAQPGSAASPQSPAAPSVSSPSHADQRGT